MKKNLIVGVIKNYSYIDLEPFLKTLAKTSYDGDLLLFHNGVDSATLAHLAKDGVMLEPFSDTFPYSETFAEENEWRTMHGVKDLSFICFRFLLYYCYLKKFGEKYDYVLLTDVGDVIFQDDPFAFNIPKDKLCCFTEHDNLFLKDSGTNCRWVEESWRGSMDKIGEHVILCAGTILGSTETILTYLKTYFDTLFAHPNPGSVNDQGLHNYTVYTHFLSRSHLYRNFDGPILTIGIESAMRYAPDGKILNQAGTAPVLIHQYNRHHELIQRFHGKRLRMKTYWNKYLRPSKLYSRARYQLARRLRAFLPRRASN